VRDLPEVWRSRYQEYLGVSSPDDRDGVMQDVHWYAGLIGGSFQGYTLGNILSAQFYEKALEAHPEIPDEIRQGKFDTLHNWLKENIYQYGSKYTAPELIERVTGGGLDVQPLMRYAPGRSPRCPPGRPPAESPIPTRCSKPPAPRLTPAPAALAGSPLAYRSLHINDWLHCMRTTCLWL
jgi:hypothetical protein